ncbi:MAG: Phosphodiesterase/alkaline phosphatase D, partial [uncultured Thermomicrobiales bacterium]
GPRPLRADARRSRRSPPHHHGWRGRLHRSQPRRSADTNRPRPSYPGRLAGCLRRRTLHPRCRLRGPVAGWRRPVDPPRSGPSRRSRRDGRKGAGRGPVGGRRRRGVRHGHPDRRGQCDPGVGPQRPRRCPGAGAGPRVLLSLPRRRRAQPGRADEDGANGGRPAGPAAVCLLLVPGLADRPLHRLSPHGAGGPGRCPLPRRLHLRGRVRSRRRRRLPRAGPGAHRAADPDDRRLPGPPRPPQERPVAPGRPRRLPLGGDLGRPRGRQRLRGRARRRRAAAGCLPAEADRWLPGVLRAPAAATGVDAARSRDAPLPPPRLRRSGRVLRPRRPSVPHRPPLWRRGAGALPGSHGPEQHDARPRAGAVAACRARCLGGPLERARPADPDGRAGAPRGGRRDLLDRRLGRLPRRPQPDPRPRYEPAHRQPGGADRGLALHVRERPQGRFREPRLDHHRDRVRRHRGHHRRRRQRLRGLLRADDPEQPAHPVLRRRRPRLHVGRGHPGAVADGRQDGGDGPRPRSRHPHRRLVRRRGRPTRRCPRL